MESAVSFAPLRPADFVNFAGRGGARPAFRGAGRGGAACFSAGRGVHPWGGGRDPKVIQKTQKWFPTPFLVETRGNFNHSWHGTATRLLDKTLFYLGLQSSSCLFVVVYKYSYFAKIFLNKQST